MFQHVGVVAPLTSVGRTLKIFNEKRGLRKFVASSAGIDRVS